MKKRKANEKGAAVKARQRLELKKVSQGTWMLDIGSDTDIAVIRPRRTSKRHNSSVLMNSFAIAVWWISKPSVFALYLLVKERDPTRRATESFCLWLVSRQKTQFTLKSKKHSPSFAY